MIQAENRKIVEIFASAAFKAGEFAKNFRHKHDLQVSVKNDDSPVTYADLQAHHLICEILQKELPDIPIISEELTDHSLTAADRFILIDPIDGTKSYISGTNDYAINIALIEAKRPIIGVIYIPEDKALFYAASKMGSFVAHPDNLISSSARLAVHKPTYDDMTMTMSSLSKKTIEKVSPFLEYPVKKIKFMGSAKKFTLIAQGAADFYPRLGATGEWDTASGDILIHEAGGFLYNEQYKLIQYGKKTFLNGGFMALSSTDIIKDGLFSIFH